MLRLEFSATYIGEQNYSVLVKGEEYLVTMESVGSTPQVRLIVLDQTFYYPSKKKFLDTWTPEEGWEKKNAQVINPLKVVKKGKKKKELDEVTNLQAGGVIYTELMMSINKFNEATRVTYENEPERMAKFEVGLEQEIYNEETRNQTGLYGAGVLKMHITMGGLKRAIWAEGISFRTAKELQNTNAYAPKLYMQLFDGLVETALLYAIATNPDDPNNIKELEDAKAQKDGNV